MPPLDMQACGVSGESAMNANASSSLRTLVDAAASTLGGHEDVAGERRRTRALKLRQTRTRNAARAQAYTSAEDSDEEDEESKVDAATNRDGEPVGDGPDKQAWKKQQRMIRNRESAALSRKRKRDRIESLEQQVERLAAEVQRLAEENRGLRQRLDTYEPSSLPNARHGRGGPQGGPGKNSGSTGRKRGAGGGGDGRARHGTSSVSCLNSRESAEFADRVLVS